MAIEIKIVDGHQTHISKGSAGLLTQVPNAITSVSNVANASGGIRAGGLVQTETK